MARIFVPSNSQAGSEALSRAVFDIMSPPEVRPPEVETEFYGEFVVHPASGAVVWGWPGGVAIHVSTEADPHEFDPIMAPYRDAGYITQADMDQVAVDVEAAKGGTLLIEETLPAFWMSQSMSIEDLDAAGFFQEVEE